MPARSKSLGATTSAAPPTPATSATEPAANGMVLLRGRLHALLDARLPGAVWLQGPTGAGKTVLLRSYLQQHGPALWLTVDDRHRDPAALFAAIDAATPGRHALPVFSPEHRDDPVAFAREFFARLDAVLPGPHALVFDDLQHLAGAAASLFAAAIDAFGGRRRLCLASQLMPDAAFAPHLAGSKLWIVGHRLLAFDESEANALAARLGSDGPAAALVGATDGWAAGLMLAMQFGRHTGTGGAADDPLAGVRAPLALLIAGQVLGGVEADELVRLRLLSELPQVPVDLVDVAPDWGQACARLQALSERGLFVERLGADRGRVSEYGESSSGPQNVTRIGRGCWRLHDLFRDALRTSGPVAAPASPGASQADPPLGQRLVDALLAVDRLDLAWQIAGALGDDALGELVASQGGAALCDPHVAGMVQLATAHANARSPAIALWQARALLGNDNGAALDACEAAYDGYRTRDDERGMTLAASLALFLVFATIEHVAAIPRWSARLEGFARAGRDEEEGDAERSIRVAAGVFLDNMIAARASTADERAAAQDNLFDRVVAQVLSPNESVLAGSLLVLAMRRLNRRADVERVIVRIEGLATFGSSAPHMRATWKIENGYYFHRIGAVASARAAFTEGLALAEDNALPQARIAALIGLVRLELGAADSGAGQRHLDQLTRIGSARLGKQGGWVVHLQARHAFGLGQATRALQLLDAAEPLIRDAGFLESATILLDLDRLQMLYGTGRWADAAPVVARIRATGSPIDRQQAEVVIGLLEAHARWSSDRETAVALLRRHFFDAERLDVALFAMLLPTVAAEVASYALDEGIHPSFVRDAIRARDLPAPHDASAAWPWPLRVELLGEFRITRHGAPLLSSGKAQQKPLELLKVLACEREMVADLHSIGNALWPDAESAAARKNLEVTVSRLRKLLGDDTLVVVKEGKVLLDGTRLSSDAREFLIVAARAESLIAQPRPAATVAAIADRLLRLFRDLPLEHEDETAWREAVRERYRNAFVRAVRTLTTFWGDDDPHRAIGLLEAAIAREPLAEQFPQLLMRIYIAQGQSAEAMRVYRHCRRMLSILLGRVPSDETERIKNLIAF